MSTVPPHFRGARRSPPEKQFSTPRYSPDPLANSPEGITETGETPVAQEETAKSARPTAIDQSASEKLHYVRMILRGIIGLLE